MRRVESDIFASMHRTLEHGKYLQRRNPRATHHRTPFLTNPASRSRFPGPRRNSLSSGPSVEWRHKHHPRSHRPPSAQRRNKPTQRRRQTRTAHAVQFSESLRLSSFEAVVGAHGGSANHPYPPPRRFVGSHILLCTADSGRSKSRLSATYRLLLDSVDLRSDVCWMMFPSDSTS